MQLPIGLRASLARLSAKSSDHRRDPLYRPSGPLLLDESLGFLARDLIGTDNTAWLKAGYQARLEESQVFNRWS